MEKLQKYNSGPMHRGISPRTPDFQTDVELSTDTTNMSHGVEQGMAVRHGFSPIPGQNDNETGTLVPRLPGLLMSEGMPASGLAARTKVLGWVQLSLPSPSDITTKINVYGAVITTEVSSITYLDIALCSTQSGGVEKISSFIYDGFGPASVGLLSTSPTVFSFLAEGIVTNAGVKTGTLPAYLTFDKSLYAASIATINVTGIDVPMAYLFGEATSPGDATHAPSSNFFVGVVKFPSGSTTNTVVTAGIPTEYQLQNFKIAQRAMKISGLTNEGQFNILYTLLVTPSSSTFKQDILDSGSVNLDVSAITATKETSGTSYSSTVTTLVNDASASSNSSFSAIAVAAGSPYLALFQGAYRAGEGRFDQWFDLSQNVWQPPVLASAYSEDFIPKSTCFAEWGDYVTGDPFSGAVSPEGPALLGADTGILRKSTVYEFTYSMYNKRLNFETNVGVPVKFATGTDDFVGLQLYWGDASGTPLTQYYKWRSTAPAGHWMPFHFGSFQDDLTKWYPPQLAINFCQYRFYYRQFGTFEWLPAGQIDAAQFWYDAYLRYNVCTGPVSSSPGGQPGGFSDYSPLPTDNYNCVVQYKNRFFWFSDQACVFSLSNNPFAYAARNSISSPTGKFLGGIVHNYPGQAEQSSRLVIFGNTGNYVARFTGIFQQTQVQVAADASATFNIEGSDLVIDPWTSVTAFSYRAAAIADGILYYWGPQGVYRDDGVQTPTKISADLEPYIFTLYDPAQTSKIHANYDDLSKEITWFYAPATADSNQTHLLIYSVLSGEFLPGAIGSQVDWVQNLPITSAIPTAGKRTMAGVRSDTGSDIQRCYFYDNRNRSGDMRPTTDWLIKTIATPSAGLRRLTLAAGYDATNFATIAVGDYLALQQTLDYDPSLAAADNMIAKIAAVNTGSGYLDITLPTGAALDASASPTFDKYFPFWTMPPTSRGLNGIPYLMKTVYWTPVGVNGYFFWLYWYLLAKYTAWKTDLSFGWELGYRSPTSIVTLTDLVTFANNSDNNFQIYHPLMPGDDNSQGQGLKLSVSGNHIGPEWVLQYMEIHGVPQFGDMLKRFEG